MTKLNSTRSTCWKHSRLCCFGPVHTGNKVEHIGSKVDCDKMLNSHCCRFVAKTGNRVEHIGNIYGNSRLCCRFRQQVTLNKADRVEFNFVASVYRTLKGHSGADWPVFFSRSIKSLIYNIFTYKVWTPNFWPLTVKIESFILALGNSGLTNSAGRSRPVR